MRMRPTRVRRKNVLERLPAGRCGQLRGTDLGDLSNRFAREGLIGREACGDETVVRLGRAGA
jgi:hypothetical protein